MNGSIPVGVVTVILVGAIGGFVVSGFPQIRIPGRGLRRQPVQEVTIAKGLVIRQSRKVLRYYQDDGRALERWVLHTAPAKWVNNPLDRVDPQCR